MYFNVKYCYHKMNFLQGGYPSPFDRNMGMKMASKSLDWLILQIKENKQSDGNFYFDTHKKKI